MNHPAPLDTLALPEVASTVGSLLLDKPQQIRLALTCIIAGGHLLIEDLPGLGKTLLAQALARSLGLAFNRVQFTSDLLPGDLLGCAIFDREQGGFRYHAGPIFTQVLLADEINRASPKTQSALLEAMEERQVSAEGETRPLPDVFFVIATQNPLDQHGVFPLPEAQLDRFLMRISLGYPSEAAELELLAGTDRRVLLADTPALLDAQAVRHLQACTAAITTSPALLAYVRTLLVETRSGGAFRHGLSPRAGQALLAAARAWALIDGRDFVAPADVQAVFMSVAAHRLQTVSAEPVSDALARLLTDVPVP